MPVRSRLRAPPSQGIIYMLDIVTHYEFWIALGVLLMIGEAAIPAVFLFYGLSAWVVATLTAGGLLIGLTSQILAFAVIGVILMLTLRRTCKRWLVGTSVKADGPEDDTGVIGKIAIVAEDFENFGYVNLNGSRWTAKSPTSHKKGDRVKIIGNEGTLFIIEAYQPE